MSEARIIKKYPNRRLYDTSSSSYITLEDIRKLVQDGAEFQVVDSKTNEDITRSILLQLIMEQEAEGRDDPLFSTEMLTQFIRFYGTTMPSMFSEFMQKSMTMFMAQQDQFKQSDSNGNPLDMMAEMTKRNMDTWMEMQKNFFQAAANTDNKDKDKS